jgi:hypothetical protein
MSFYTIKLLVLDHIKYTFTDSYYIMKTWYLCCISFNSYHIMGLLSLVMVRMDHILNFNHYFKLTSSFQLIIRYH